MKMLACVGALALLCLRSVMCQTTMAPVTPMQLNDELFFNDSFSRDVLLHHVVDRKTLYSIGMRHTLTYLTADQGHDYLMILEDFATGDIKVNTACIVQKDISATNGIIHIIDEALVPARVLLKIEEQGITIG
ncbi:hypothetical protein RRG08_060521 [Elysia crispata]|uniref:FAS1 domain-containing protein n=1 Tax=Elysia crispata TaxID=231223 RepID=A0AAE1DV48_9GAST|nr:hypothetical protein RRG08_060521 [Elysia crispata]